ncbi:MAG: hypothetical protein V4515_03855 [Chloroflexota bacterium]
MALIGVLLLQACGPSATPGPSTNGPAAGATEDGLVLWLAVDQAAVPPGGELRFHAQVRNTASNPVLWWGGDCRLEGAITVAAGDGEEPSDGLDWTGDAGALKVRLLAGSGRPGSPRTVAASANDTTCRVDRGFNALRPQDAIDIDTTWSASDLIGAPLAPGSYRVIATFPRVRSNIVADPALIDLTRDLATVATVVEIQVGPVAGSRVSAADAVDIALGTPAFARWIGAHPAPTWSGTSLRWVDGTWHVEIRTTTGASANLNVDGGSGTITVLQLGR